jgi:hypothetical protein
MGWYLPKPNHVPIANILYFKQFQNSYQYNATKDTKVT